MSEPTLDQLVAAVSVREQGAQAEAFTRAFLANLGAAGVAALRASEKHSSTSPRVEKS